jgi:hypothetical protein
LVTMTSDHDEEGNYRTVAPHFFLFVETPSTTANSGPLTTSVCAIWGLCPDHQTALSDEELLENGSAVRGKDPGGDFGPVIEFRMAK